MKNPQTAPSEKFRDVFSAWREAKASERLAIIEKLQVGNFFKTKMDELLEIATSKYEYTAKPLITLASMGDVFQLKPFADLLEKEVLGVWPPVVFLNPLDGIPVIGRLVESGDRFVGLSPEQRRARGSFPELERDNNDDEAILTAMKEFETRLIWDEVSLENLKAGIADDGNLCEIIDDLLGLIRGQLHKREPKISELVLGDLLARIAKLDVFGQEVLRDRLETIKSNLIVVISASVILRDTFIQNMHMTENFDAQIEQLLTLLTPKFDSRKSSEHDQGVLFESLNARENDWKSEMNLPLSTFPDALNAPFQPWLDLQPEVYSSWVEISGDERKTRLSNLLEILISMVDFVVGKRTGVRPNLDFLRRIYALLEKDEEVFPAELAQAKKFIETMERLVKYDAVTCPTEKFRERFRLWNWVGQHKNSFVTVRKLQIAQTLHREVKDLKAAAAALKTGALSLENVKRLEEIRETSEFLGRVAERLLDEAAKKKGSDDGSQSKEEKKGKMSKGAVIAVVVGGVAVAGGIGFFLFYRHKGA